MSSYSNSVRRLCRSRQPRRARLPVACAWCRCGADRQRDGRINRCRRTARCHRVGGRRNAGDRSANRKASEGHLGWDNRPHRAASRLPATTVDDQLSQYSMTYADRSVPAAGTDDFNGYIATTPGTPLPGAPSMGKVSQETAKQQVSSDFTTLSYLLPPGTLTASSVDIIPLIPSQDLYALSIRIDLDNADALHGHIGDTLQGFDTGLVGGADAAVEGIETTVYVQGTPMIGSWASNRGHYGGQWTNPSLQAGRQFTETMAFPNLTGLPSPGAIGNGAPCAGTTTGSPPTHAASAPRAAPVHRSSRTWIVYLIAATALTGAVALVLRRVRARSAS